MEGDAMDVESQRLIARLREFETQNAELRDDAATWKARAEFSYGERSKLEAQNAELLAALEKALERQAYRRGHGPDWWEEGTDLVDRVKGGSA